MSDTHPGTGQTVTLAADLYRPNTGSGPWPTILVQAPYGKGNSYLQFLTERAADPLFNSTNYAWVVMDWRGFGISGSQNMDYSGSPDRGADGYDAVEWISQQSWCVSGKVATWGASALGNVQLRTAALRPPSLVCAMPIVYHWREWYDQCYPGGVYSRNRNDFVFGLFGGLAFIRSIPLKTAVWDSVEAAGNPADLNIPMLHVTGWYDHETLQTIREMQSIQTGGGTGAVGNQKLLIGPWAHSAVGARAQNQIEYPTAEFADSIEALAFFDHYLRGITNGWESRPVIRFFQLNEDAWATTATWPPPFVTNRVFYLQSDRTLARPTPTTTNISFSWTSDPTNPAPSLCSAVISPPPGETQGPGDLAALELRADVIAFTTAPLREPLAISGNGRAVLWVRCSATNTDVHVRLTQVYPDQRSIWLGDAVRRLSLRNGFAAHQWPDSATSYEVELDLPPLGVTIPPGHRLRVLITSGNYDRFDVNMQDGSDLSDEAGAQPVTATVTLSADAARPSRLILPTWRGTEKDTDADGLPDWWETLHFGNATNAAPATDADGDGLSNRRELEAGTEPGEVTSVLKVTGLTPVAQPQTGFWIEWNSVAERDYTVLQSQNLIAWTPSAQTIVGTPPTNRLFIPHANGAAAGFYKIETWR